MAREYDKTKASLEVQHVQAHHEQHLQAMFRESNQQNMLRLFDMGFHQGYDTCLADVKKMSIEAFTAMKGENRG